MNGMNGMSEKKVGSGPKTRMCYICGRQYGLSSFEIHIKQCRELWIAREALKIKSERKPVPKDPCAGGGGGGGGGGGCDGLQDTLNNKGTSGMNLEEINRMASETFNTVSLSQCEHCGRSFLHEKLVIHNRSCTAEKPGRRAPVKPDAAAAAAAASKAPEPPIESPSPKKEKASAPQRSTTPQKSTGQASQSSPKNSTSPAPEKPKEEVGDVSSSSDSLPLAGHLGGTGGRPIRAANHSSSSSSEKNGNGPQTDDSAEIFELSRRVEEMEGVVEQLVASIAEVKQTLVTLRKNQATAGDE